MQKEKDMPLDHVQRRIRAEMESKGVIFVHGEPVLVSDCVILIHSQYGGKSLYLFEVKNPFRFAAIWITDWK